MSDKYSTMTRIAQTARVRVPQSQVIDLVGVFFSERPQLNVRGLGSSAAEVDVHYELLCSLDKGRSAI